MKKIIALLLALTMVFALCACGKSATKLTYAARRTSRTYYGFSGVIANVVKEKLFSSATAIKLLSSAKSMTASLDPIDTVPAGTKPKRACPLQISNPREKTTAVFIAFP